MNGYNFTEGVRRILAMAREEAVRLHHEYVGTEHVLLSMLHRGEGGGMRVLEGLSSHTAAMTGAEHGAATKPDIAPMVNAPDTLPAVPAVLARSKIDAGIRTGRTSSIARAASNNKLAIAKYSHGLVLTDPKSVPVSPAKRPKAE